MNDDLTPDTTHSTEIDHGHAEYSVEELLEQCQGNAASLLLATLSVLAEQGMSVDAWAAGGTLDRGRVSRCAADQLPLAWRNRGRRQSRRDRGNGVD